MNSIKIAYIAMEHIKIIITIILIMLALISDIRTYKIKNRLVGIFIIIGIATNVGLQGKQGIGFSFIGIISPVVILFLLYYLKMLGAGDIKLFSAIGAVMGVRFVVYAMAYSFLAGGIIALFIMLMRKNVMIRFKYFVQYIKACILSGLLLPYSDLKNKGGNEKFPFAYGIFLGTVYTFLTFL